ncbi:unnamed protein product, partial [Prorocentrum cordatum]
VRAGASVGPRRGGGRGPCGAAVAPARRGGRGALLAAASGATEREETGSRAGAAAPRRTAAACDAAAQRPGLLRTGGGVADPVRVRGVFVLSL